MENYTIVKRLGDGAQAVTLLCVDKRTSTQVVVKKMPSGLRSSEEINVSLRVKHPNIVECLEVFSKDDFVYLVTRYAEGGDLEQFLARRSAEKKPIPPLQISRWVGQMCRALHHVHQSHCMHRDIKPSNIFLSKDESQVYLGDFGVAKMFQGSLDVATTFVGSPIWLSPEVLSGTPYGYMADVWSLGCVIYEIITLRKPFAAPHFAALVMRICSGQFDPIPVGIPQHLRAVVEGMINIDVNERWLLTDVLNSSDHFAKAPPSRSTAAGGGSLQPRQRREQDDDNATVDLAVWAKAKLREIGSIEKYLAKHKANDVIILQRVDREQQLEMRKLNPQLAEEGGAGGKALNPERAKRMLPSPAKATSDAWAPMPQQLGGRSPVDVMVLPHSNGDRPPQDRSRSPSLGGDVSVVHVGQRWADFPQPGVNPVRAPRKGKPIDAPKESPSSSPPLPPSPLRPDDFLGLGLAGGPPAPHNGLSLAPPPKRNRPSSGQPALSMPDLPSPPSKQEKRDAQRMDIKAMIRENRARAAASGGGGAGGVAVEIILPANLRNLPQNKV